MWCLIGCADPACCVVCFVLCDRPAGVTVYAPLRKYINRPDCKVAVLGVGGLGHLAVQFADKMGADVSVHHQQHLSCRHAGWCV